MTRDEYQLRKAAHMFGWWGGGGGGRTSMCGMAKDLKIIVFFRITKYIEKLML